MARATHGEDDRTCKSAAHGTCIGSPLPRIERVPIDHVKLPITDLDASRAYCTAALAPFGWKLVYDDGDSALRYAAFDLDPDGHNIEAFYHRR